MARVIEMIDAARASGLDVTADMYPYVANGTGLTSVLPPWAEADGKLYENLSDPVERARIKAEALNPSGDWEAMAEWAGPEGVMPVGFERAENRQYAGMRLTEIQEARGDADWVETAFELLLSERQRIGTIYFSMSEDNLVEQLRQPWIKVSTDAGGLDPEWAEAMGPTHPRAYGTYTRVLGKYVREEDVLTWEDAIRKMTSSVADRLSLRDRGILRAGAYADVVIFDPETVTDNATFEQSHQLSTGVRDVWVNGARVVAGGAHTGASGERRLRPGRGHALAVAGQQCGCAQQPERIRLHGSAPSRPGVGGEARHPAPSWVGRPRSVLIDPECTFDGIRTSCARAHSDAERASPAPAGDSRKSGVPVGGRGGVPCLGYAVSARTLARAAYA